MWYSLLSSSTQGRTTKIMPVSRDCWTTADEFDAIKTCVHSIDFADAVESRWKWEAMWKPVIVAFEDLVIPNRLELANIHQSCTNPLAQKKVDMFRSW